MKNTVYLLGGTVVALHLFTAIPAYALSEDFTAHHLVPKEPYAPYARTLPAPEKLELRHYLEYEHREPCQFYRKVPAGFIKDGCDIAAPPPPPAPPPAAVPLTAPSPEPMDNLTDAIADYRIYFAFDSANIEPAAYQTLDHVAREIYEYKPNQVTVAGHADRAGPASYNIGLSQRRAQAVSEALNRHGVEDRILNMQAFGESQPLIETPDGMPLRENRRVAIEFQR